MKNNRFLKTFARALIGACAGAATAFLGFVVLDFLILGSAAIMRNEFTDRSAAIVLTVVCCGTVAGAIVSTLLGGLEMRGTAKHITLGILGGVGIDAILGFISAQFYYPPASEVHKVAWLTYGVPIGMVIGGIVGCIYSYFYSWKKTRTSKPGSS